VPVPVQLVQQVVQGNVARVDAEDELFGLGPRQQVRVEQVSGEALGHGGRQRRKLRGVRRGLAGRP
jgi:hypothetical protein